NVGRGACVVEEDLARAITEEQIAGAGLDVLEVEPLPSNNPLLGIRNSMRLIITPHIAWASVESRTRCVNEVYENIRSFIHDGKGRNLVG
ncbi:MAG: D-2-hydroxyacid dehydrogenase, partial [Muribaculaceae bacterium]|nr:D-2-hydroxyacid dehydrogenase [Muribaculaceae bacterium]